MADDADDAAATAPGQSRRDQTLVSDAPTENEIEVGASRLVAQTRPRVDELPPARTAPLLPDDEKAKGLPQGLRDRYLQVGDRFFRDASAKDAAFEDHGTRLKGADAGVARDLVAIAGHRGWQEIHVRGSEDFRREVWREASALGISVSGYRPSELERAELRRAAEGTISRVDRSDSEARGGDARTAPTRPDFNAGITGRIVAIGAEKYDDRARSTTPYLDIEAADGRRHRAWGITLDEAVREAGVKVGDQATIRRAGRDPVEVTTEDGRIATERNRWTISVAREAQKASPSRDMERVGRGPGHELAERFLRQDHAENARDPKLRAAQSHVMLAQAAARQRHGGDDQAVDRAVKAAKIDLATKLSRGQTIEAAQVKDRGRAQAEQTREMLLRDRPARGR